MPPTSPDGAPQLPQPPEKAALAPAVWAMAAVAFLEGYATLAVEIYAVRASATVLGTSVTVTGILLGAVLAALSLGYYLGGRAAARLPGEALMPTVAARLAVAALCYAALLPLHETVVVAAFGATRSVVFGTLLVGLAYVLPVTLASQALPLMAQRLSLAGRPAGESAGLFLAVSTVGSVAGVALTPLVLFDTVGVRATGAILVLVTVAAALFALWPWRLGMGADAHPLAHQAVFLAAAAAAGAGLGLLPILGERGRHDTAHQTFSVVEEPEGGRMVRQLRSGLLWQTAVVASDLSPVGYARAMVDLAPDEVRRVLVVGAAGFAMPEALAARGAEVTALDIDPRVKDIAERVFLRRPLSPGITFLPLDARFAVRSMEPGSFDLAMLDAFTGVRPPQHLFSVEALRETAAVARLVSANVIVDPPMETLYARRIFATWRRAFPEGGFVLLPPRPGGRLANAILCSWACEGSSPLPETQARAYTDDLSGLERDGEALIALMLRPPS